MRVVAAASVAQHEHRSGQIAGAFSRAEVEPSLDLDIVSATALRTRPLRLRNSLAAPALRATQLCRMILPKD